MKEIVTTDKNKKKTQYDVNWRRLYTFPLNQGSEILLTWGGAGGRMGEAGFRFSWRKALSSFTFLLFRCERILLIHIVRERETSYNVPLGSNLKYIFVSVVNTARWKECPRAPNRNEATLLVNHFIHWEMFLCLRHAAPMPRPESLIPHRDW